MRKPCRRTRGTSGDCSVGLQTQRPAVRMRIYLSRMSRCFLYLIDKIPNIIPINRRRYYGNGSKIG